VVGVAAWQRWRATSITVPASRTERSTTRCASFDRRGPKLLTQESVHEAAPSDFATVFKAPEGDQQLTPFEGECLTQSQFSEHHAVALSSLLDLILLKSGFDRRSFNGLLK